MFEAFGIAFGMTPPFYGSGPRPFYMVGRPGFWGGFGGWLDMFTPTAWEYTTYFEHPGTIDVSTYMDWYLAGRDLMRTAEAQEQLKLAS